MVAVGAVEKAGRHAAVFELTKSDAWAGIVATELLDKLLIAVDNSRSSLDVSFAQGSLVVAWTSARKQSSPKVDPRMVHLLGDRSTVLVFGPAYLDRVIRVGQPLVDPELSPALDQSVDGTWRFGKGLQIEDASGSFLDVDLPGDWTGPQGKIALSRPLLSPGDRRVSALDWHDDLGGMGAGYAKAFGAKLVSALGAEDDPTSQSISALLTSVEIEHRPVRIVSKHADWTLLISSGGFGDKLPPELLEENAALVSRLR